MEIVEKQEEWDYADTSSLAVMDGKSQITTQTKVKYVGAYSRVSSPRLPSSPLS
jgi:hypothetical protein